MTSPVPAGAAMVVVADRETDLGLTQHFRQRGNDDGAGHRAGETATAADHQHGDDQEGEVKVEVLDPHDAKEMAEQHAGHAGEEGGDDERDQAMADDVDAGGLRRGFVLARGAQQQGRARLLIGKGDHDCRNRPGESGPQVDIEPAGP